MAKKDNYIRFWIIGLLSSVFSLWSIFYTMLHLTSHERKTIIFILSLLVLGIGLDFYKKKANRVNLIDIKILEEQLYKKVDINKATASELATIPGVGEELAYSIVNYRNLNGDFKDIEEMKEIKGIKEKKLEQLRKYITLGSFNYQK